jgi:formate dehydrogenase accessory protein FdhD
MDEGDLMGIDPAALRDVTTIRAGEVGRRPDLLVQEITRTFRINGSVAATAICSPGEPTGHCIGFLLTEGYLLPGEIPVSLEQDGDTVSVELAGSRTPPEPLPVESGLVVDIKTIMDLTKASSELDALHRQTGGTHSASLCLDGAIAFHAEDISRNAAFEKAVGCAALRRNPMERSILCLSSRVPSGFVRKAARVRLPIIAAVSAPTLQAAEEAERLGICLCGFVRGTGANVYSCPWRVGLERA